MVTTVILLSMYASTSFRLVNILLRNNAAIKSFNNYFDGTHVRNFVHNKKHTVLVSPSVPAFINTTTITSPVLIQPDTDAVLHCTGQGVPTPYITWSMGGVLLSIDNKYSLFPNGSLVIHNTMTSNAGQYVCIAENSAGQSEFVFNVLFG